MMLKFRNNSEPFPFTENRINVLLQRQHTGLNSTEDIVSDMLKTKKKKFNPDPRLMRIPLYQNPILVRRHLNGKSHIC